MFAEKETKRRTSEKFSPVKTVRELRIKLQQMEDIVSENRILRQQDKKMVRKCKKLEEKLSKLKTNHEKQVLELKQELQDAKKQLDSLQRTVIDMDS